MVQDHNKLNFNTNKTKLLQLPNRGIKIIHYKLR